MPARPGSERDLAAAAARLGYRFRRRALLGEALTHASAAGPARPDNQRMEFLGDRVLGLVIAGALIEAYPDEAEGGLAPRLNALVRRETLADVAREIGLGQHLVLGRSENLSGGRRKTAILADAMEAVIAALYLDGGLPAAEAFIRRHWAARLHAAETAATDAKSALQAWAQARGLGLPRYAERRRTGPDHAPRFEVEVSVDGPDGETLTAEGAAAGKRQAERAAAAALLDRLEREASAAGGGSPAASDAARGTPAADGMAGSGGR
ncbi:MAG: ribonuclease III [Pseudomonadota bacterium]